MARQRRAIPTGRDERFPTFLPVFLFPNKLSEDDKLHGLNQLLLRILAVVEEADGRYITNSAMLKQLEFFAESMYQGYHMLDTFKHKSHVKGITKEEVRHSSTLSTLSFGLKRSRTMDDPSAALMVLPVIGGCRVGKKVLISHVCTNERVQSHFSSILHISGNNIQSIENTTFRTNVKTLVVIEFIFDIDDDEWIKFYSSATKLSEGSKVIIMSRLGKVARFGTVKPVYLNSLSEAEYSYLFKMLAFGNTDQRAYPQQVSVANELAIVLGGSLITANVIADLLRRNLNVQFWLHILKRFKEMVENNLSKYGEHPKDIIEKEHPIDISRFASTCPTSLRLMPPRVEKDESPERKLPVMMFGDLIAGSMSVPNEEFELVAWKSRIPPYTKYVQSVEACDDQMPRSMPHKRKRKAQIENL
ncbi:hypothetical protein EJB05_26623, partial [Eragrostis curvula]